ncbi:MAG TPA: hypothetical protein VGF56_03385 [Rhizomicrobium sp.]|jgi:hypothetical protein
MKHIGWIAVSLALASAASAETLSVPPYPGAPWKEITHKQDARQLLIEWIPADQNEAGIKDILTEQAFYGNTQDPGEFVRGFLARVGGACRDAKVNGPKLGSENGHAVAYAQAYCVGQKGADKDVDIFLKAIAGHDALYVVQREFRRPAEPGAMPGMTVFPKDQKDAALARLHAQGEADHFLVDKVRLCDGACADAVKDSAAKSDAASDAPKSDPDSDFINGFVNGKSTKAEIRDKLGAPFNESHMGNRSVYMYQYKDGAVIVTYLFDEHDVLLRFRAYAKNQ